MKKTLRTTCWLIGAFFVIVSSVAQSPTEVSGKRREVFGDNGSFERLSTLPKNALAALIASKEASYARDYVQEKPGTDLNELFVAVEVRLAGPKENDYVVEGNFPLTGADCNWFWIVRVNAKTGRASVLLFDNADTIELLLNRTMGLRNIRTMWESPNERITKIYHFDGERYKLAHKYDKITWGKP
jgi:hypothetical protein